MSRSGSLRFILTALATVSLIITVPGWAQLIPTGSILGTIKDPQGGVAPNAAITVTSVRTGISRSTTSNGMGEFLVPDLLPDTYRVEAVLHGFKKFEQQATVQEAKSTTVDFTLQIGSTMETVQVTAGAPLLQTTTASLSTVIGDREISDLPLIGRNTIMLEMIGTGIVNTYGSSGASGTGYSANQDLAVGGTVNAGYIQGAGGWYEEADYYVDGIPDTIMDRPAYIPPPDQVEEMSVMQAPLDAQYGHAGSSTIVIVSKAGTNQFHGAVYDYLQNSVFNANGFFSNLSGIPKPPLKLNQFGGTLGGPIKHNKTFFYFNYEGSRTTSPSTDITTVPTAAQRTGDFSQTFNQQGQLIQIYNPFTTAPNPSSPGQYIRTAFPGNVIPSTLINPASAALLGLIPLPNQPGQALTGANNYVVIVNSGEALNDYSARVDHQFTQNNRFFGRFSREKTDYTSSPTFPALPSAPSWVDQVNVGAGYTTILSPSTVLDFELGWSTYRYNVPQPHTNLTNLGFSPEFVSEMSEPVVPQVSIASMTSFGYPASRINHTATWGFNANATHTRGRQTMKGGFQTQIKSSDGGYPYGLNTTFNFDQGFTQGPNPSTVGSNVGFGLASYLLGTMLNTSNATTPLSTTTNAPYYGFYFQDDIRATSKLSVNIGLRWELWQDATDRFNRETAGWAFDTPNPIQAQAQANYAAIEPASMLSLLSPSQFGAGILGGYLYTTPSNRRWGETYWNNWDPRIGIAYRLTPKTVIRAGYGIFRAMFWSALNNTTGFSTSTSAAGSLNTITPYNLFNNPFPTGVVQPSGSSLGLSTNLGQAVSVFDQYARPTTNARWNLGFQRQITPSVMFEAYYVGNTDYHMTLGSAGEQFSSGLDEEQDFALAYLPAKYYYLGSQLENLVPNPFYGLPHMSSGSESAPTIMEGQLLSTYPEFTAIDDERKTDGRTYYDALQATVTKRLTHGLSLLGTYTWSRQIDRYRYINPSDSGPSKMIGYFDAPQRFTLSGVYDLPFGPGRSWGWRSGAGGKLIGGWQVGLIGTFQSGQPINLDSPVYLTGVDPNLPPSQRSPWDWFKLAALAPLPAFTLRSAPWSLANLRADAYNNWDFSFTKNTSIRENLKLQFRWEMQNAFNKCVFSEPDVTPTDTTYGTINAQANVPRQMQVSLKFIF